MARSIRAKLDQYDMDHKPEEKASKWEYLRQAFKDQRLDQEREEVEVEEEDLPPEVSTPALWRPDGYKIAGRDVAHTYNQSAKVSNRVASQLQ